MSVILLKEDEEEWLNRYIIEPERLWQLLKQYPEQEMEAYPVSSAVNILAHTSLDLIKPPKSK